MTTEQTKRQNLLALIDETVKQVKNLAGSEARTVEAMQTRATDGGTFISQLEFDGFDKLAQASVYDEIGQAFTRLVEQDDHGVVEAATIVLNHAETQAKRHAQHGASSTSRGSNLVQTLRGEAWAKVAWDYFDVAHKLLTEIIDHMAMVRS